MFIIQDSGSKEVRGRSGPGSTDNIVPSKRKKMSDRTANGVTANGRGGVTAHGASVTHNGASVTHNGASATHNGGSVTASTSVMLVAGQGPGQRTAVVPKVLTARKRTKNGVLKAPTELWLV